jgi:hypothetical protein
MLLIITPSSGWLREIEVFDLTGATEADAFEAFQAVNSLYDMWGKRDSVNITIAHIPVEQVEAWLRNHVEPIWWERLWGRYRLNVTRVVKETP